MPFRSLFQLVQISRKLRFCHFPARGKNDLVKEGRHNGCLNYTGRYEWSVILSEGDVSQMRNIVAVESLP
jgi:hypothetical protein